ncbi:MAG: DUF1127 domain-containing protein [Alphaproteobacteria bacterium]|nr:DUF1127 domain-containing protein [Alphaproteobacteria bacterium]
MTTRLRYAVLAAPRLFDWRALLAWSRASADRARQRRRLAEMSDRELKDIGVSRADAVAESEKTWFRGVLSR